MIRETAEKILNELTRKSDDAAVKVTNVGISMIKYANSQPSVIQNWTKTTITLYINREGRIYVTDIDSASPIDNTRDLLEKTETYRIMEPSMYNAPLPQPETTEAKSIVIDKKIIELTQDLDKIMGVVYQPTQNYDIDRFAGKIELGQTHSIIMTSKGFVGEEKTTFIDGYIRAFKGERSGQWAFTSTSYNEELIKTMVERACDYATLKLPYVKLDPGKTSVILSPMVFSNLIDYIADMSTATSIDMGFSFLLKYNKGQKIASEKLSLYDIPLDKEMPYTTTFDDEGIKTYNKPIIENGVLKTILHNTKTAVRRNEKTTGNAGWLSPHPWNLEVKEGEQKLDEMIKETKNGILITNNWYTRLQNYIEGDFSTVGRDAIIIIKNGELAGLVHRIRIADKFPKLINNIEELTREKYPIQWWEVDTPVRVPFVKIKEANVTLPE